MVDIAFPVLAFFASLAVVMFTFSILAKRLIDAYVPVLALLAGVMWIMIFITYDQIDVLGSPANSTKTISPSTIDHMNVFSGTASQTLRSGSNIFIGEEIATASSALTDKRIDEICMTLSKTGSPTGTANIAVYSSTLTPSSTNYRFLVNTLDVSSLTTTSQLYCFLATSVFQLDGTGSAIGIFYNGGSAGNEVNVISNGSDPFDSTNSYRTQYVASWSDTTGNDLKMRISLATIDENVSNVYTKQDISFNTNEGARLRLFFLIIGITFMIAGIAERYSGSKT